MTEDLNNENELRAFLLGESSEDERTGIEDRYLGDGDFAAQIHVVEDELIEDYLRRELSADDRQRFEATFLVQPRRRERVLAMKAVLQVVNAEPVQPTSSSLWASMIGLFTPKGGFAPYAIAAGVLLVLGIGALLAFNKLSTQSSGPVAQQSPAPFRPEATASVSPESIESPAPPSPTPPSRPSPSLTPDTSQVGPTLASIVLRPTLTRDPSAAHKLVVLPSVKQINLQLILENNDYRTYAIRITTVGGQLVWQGRSVKAQHGSLVLSLPSARLPTDDYLVEVSGVTPTGSSESLTSYFFSVTRK